MHALEPVDTKRVVGAVSQFGKDPFHPSLNLEKLNGAPGIKRLHSIRASKDIRILLAKQGDTYVMLEAGQHDAIYARALRSSFVVAPAAQYVGLVDLSDGPSPEPARRATRPTRDDRPGVLDHWADAELIEAGLTIQRVQQLRRCKNLDRLLDDLPDLDDDTLELILELVEVTPEQWRSPAMIGAEEAEERRVREALVEFGALSGISPLFSPDELQKLASAPIEDWMVFLHPDQRAIVDRRLDGPARVRGGAGTGKTVVALHRAAALASRFAETGEDDKPILFTTYIKTLPPVFRSLYRRLPNAVDGAVEFEHVDRLARKICNDSGDKIVTAPKLINDSFSAACRMILPADSPLVRAGLSQRYLRDEITYVIKGRGVGSVDEYLAMERSGRQTRFTEPLRRQAWNLMREWDRQMAERGTIDFIDVILRARNHARRLTEPRYRAVIVDEAQDLTLVGLQLLRSLVNGPAGKDRSDGLFIVGDGAQRIYPGGFTLRQAGVEVRGRTSVLRVNYRNTREILSSAMAVAGEQTVDDLGEELKRAEGDGTAVRPGIRPMLYCADSWAEELEFVVAHIQRLVGGGALGTGDIGVFAPTKRDVASIQKALGQADLPSQDLEDYDGEPNDNVKVGTYHRAKGLEFKVVLLPGLSQGRFPTEDKRITDESERSDRRTLEVSQLYVAMTRARDGLFVTCSGSPSDVIEPALESFEVVDG